MSALVHVCRDLLKSGPSPEIASRLRALIPPKGSFVRADPIDNGRAIAARIKHRPRKNPPTENPRLFDTPAFAAMLLMHAAGLRFRFKPMNDADRLRYYLRVERSTRSGGRIYLARVIVNTPPDASTPFLDDHHDYRRRALALAPPGPHLSRPTLGRPEAISLAVSLYADNPGLGIPPDQFGSLLSALLEANDKQAE